MADFIKLSPDDRKILIEASVHGKIKIAAKCGAPEYPKERKYEIQPWDG